MPKRRAVVAGSKAAHRVVVVAYDQLKTFEYSMAAEIFGAERPRSASGWYQLQTAAAEDGPLRAGGGLVVAADGGLELLAAAGTIIVPGWRMPKHVIPEPLVGALHRAHQDGSRVVSLCSGAFALAEAGVLSRRRATTHWQHIDDFERRYPDIRVEHDVLYVDEGDVMTAAGSASGIDLCLHIVRQDYGPEAANDVARVLVVPPHRSGGQAQYVHRPVPPSDTSRLSPLLDWMRMSLAEDLSLTRLGKKAGMSHRSFIRHFLDVTGSSPGEWVLNERLSLACNLLETMGSSIDDVAYRSGLGSAATLRHHFRQRFSTTPTAYRFQFSRIAEAAAHAH